MANFYCCLFNYSTYLPYPPKLFLSLWIIVLAFWYDETYLLEREWSTRSGEEG